MSRRLLVVLASLAACHAPGAPGPEAHAVAPSAVPEPTTPSITVSQKVPSFRVDRVDSAATITVPNGKVTILTFIATWNEPAKKSLPKLQEVYLQLAPRGLEILAVYVDDTVDNVREFGATYGAKFPFAWDKDRIAASKLRPETMPTTYIIDRAGVVRFHHRGFREGDAEVMAREAATLL